MSFRMALRPLLACCALFVLAPAGFSQVKVVVVDVQRAILDTAEVKKASAEMEATFKPRSDELQKLQAEIDALSAQLQSGKLTPAQESEVTALGKRKQTDLQRKQDDLNADAEAYRNDVLQKSSAKLNEVVKKLAEEKGYDLVVQSTVAVYFKNALDITNDVIAAYDKAHPAVVPPASKK